MKTAMIFAAGLGTRLRPLTDTMPKALVSVGGKPLLQIVMEKLQKAGYNRVVINVHHFADQIIEWCHSHPTEMDVLISDERNGLLETGGGIRHARQLLQGCDRFLIHNVDILSNVDFSIFDCQKPDTVATLLVSNRQTQRYLLFDDDMRLVGWTNVSTGEVRSPYPNLDTSRYQKYAFAGIHQMSTSLFPLFDEWPDVFGIIDFYLRICDKHPVYGCMQEELRLLDVGKVDTLTQAEEFVHINC